MSFRKDSELFWEDRESQIGECSSCGFVDVEVRLYMRENKHFRNDEYWLCQVCAESSIGRITDTEFGYVDGRILDLYRTVGYTTNVILKHLAQIENQLE